MTEREQLLDELRPAAFAIAYRMLGRVSEADDVAQEALLRVHQAPAHRTKQRVDAHTDPRREADDDSPGNQQQSDDETLR